MHGTPSRFAVLLFLAASGIGGCRSGPPVTAASGEPSSACAITLGGRIHCWYRNDKLWVPGVADATMLAVHRDRGCAIRTGGVVTCWRIDMSELEKLTTEDVKLDAPTRIVVTQGLACALVAGGAVTCFKTIRGLSEPIHPERALGLDDAVDLGVHSQYAYALRRGGAIVRLSVDGGSTPKPDATIPGAVQIVVGESYHCTRTDAGVVWCGGSNWMGALGDGALDAFDYHAPRPVASLAPVVEIAGGSAHVCARHVGGDVSCWGSNQFGQVGVASSGLSDARPTPERVLGVTAVALVATTIGTCAITTKRDLVCWGSNSGWEARPHRMQLSAP